MTFHAPKGVLLNGTEPRTGDERPLAPKPKTRNLLITSALPYVNNVPHLGTLIGCILSADVFARFGRLRGYNVLYVSGTDEYGTATETKALAEQTTPRAICDKYNAIHRDVYAWFNIAFDHFGRTSTAEQTSIAQDIFSKLLDRGLMETDTVEQLYCKACERFLADRFVEGVCPLCGYKDARGDQCDGCGKLLSPTDLKAPRCKVDGSTPEVRGTEHIFLALPLLEKAVRAYVAKSSVEGHWTANTDQITRQWLSEGLKPRCITRDLSWGTPVPVEAKPELARFAGKVFYVWFDAPIGYISITATFTDQWEAWWKAGNTKQYGDATDEEIAAAEAVYQEKVDAEGTRAAPAATSTVDDRVQLYQFMGKDNVPFHSVIFPASLIGADDNYTLTHHMSTTEYIQYEDGKFSKSRGTGVFCDSARDTGIPAFVWRFYLLANRPETADTVFSWQDFMTKTNQELNANLGNFAQRTIKFVNANFDGVVPPANARTELEEELEATVSAHLVEYAAKLEAVELRDGLRVCMALSTEANKYMQVTKPWQLVKDDATKERGATVMHYLVQLLAHIAQLCEPFMPSLAKALRAQLRVELCLLSDAYQTMIPAGHKVAPSGEPLIPRLRADQVTEWKKQFGGQKDERPRFMLDLRVGRIEQVERHAEDPRLYVLRVALGDETRQVVSALADHYAEDALLQRLVVVCCNLKSGAFKGVPSEGMLLTAVAPAAAEGEAARVVLLDVPAGSTLGAPVAPVGAQSNRGSDDKPFNTRKWSVLGLELNADRHVECAGASVVSLATAVVDKKLKKNFTKRITQSGSKAGKALEAAVDGDGTSVVDEKAVALAAKKRENALAREQRELAVEAKKAERLILVVDSDESKPVSVSDPTFEAGTIVK